MHTQRQADSSRGPLLAATTAAATDQAANVMLQGRSSNGNDSSNRASNMAATGPAVASAAGSWAANNAGDGNIAGVAGWSEAAAGGYSSAAIVAERTPARLACVRVAPCVGAICGDLRRSAAICGDP